MVNDVRHFCILQSAPGGFLSESKGLSDPRLWEWTPEYLAAQKFTCVVLPWPNMDSSSFAHHHTWQLAKLNQIGTKTDMTLLLASTMQSATKLDM